MATLSCYPNLRYLQADCIREQSAILHDLANDVHYAAKIFNYKAYDFEDRSLALRHAAWKDRSVFQGNQNDKATRQIEENALRAQQLVKENKLVLEIAGEVKKGLKTLIQILNSTTNNDSFNSKGTNLQKRAVDIDLAAKPTIKADLEIPLEDLLAAEVCEARRVFTDSSKFVPVNFRAMSTPTSHLTEIDKLEQGTPKTSQLQSIDETSVAMCPAATEEKEEKEEKVGYVQKSLLQPPSCTIEEMEKELSEWIPSNEISLNLPLLPVDEKWQELMRQEGRRHQDEWAY